MQITTLWHHDCSEEDGSDGTAAFLKEAAVHPEIATHKPTSPYGESYLTRLNKSGLCCWCKPIRGGRWQWCNPFFRIDSV